MNGRIYDPQLGRFLSADVLVQFPEDLQSFNRYSYIANNPLSAIDVTGFTITLYDETLAYKARDSYQSVLGDSAVVEVKTIKYRNSFFGIKYGEEKTKYEIEYQGETPSEEMLNENIVLSDFVAAVDSDINIKIVETKGKNDTRGNTVLWNPNTKEEAFVYDPNDSNPQKIYKVDIPTEISLWHETIAHGLKGYEHTLNVGDSDHYNNYFPSSYPSHHEDTGRVTYIRDKWGNEIRTHRDYDSDKTYDPSIRVENKAREARRAQGESGQEYWPRVHQYVPWYEYDSAALPGAGNMKYK